MGSRDKITCLRHYAFNHKKAFEVCPEEDFKPRVSGHPIKDIPKGGKPYQERAKNPSVKTSSLKTPSITKKSRKSPEKFMPDLTDSDSDVPKKKPVKEDDVKKVDTEKITFTSDDED